MAYADLAAELAGTISGLSPILAATYVKRAWQDIVNERNWSFKTALATLVCPAQITTGTAAWTQYTTTLAFSPAATTALTPFVGGTPAITDLQVRFSGGPLYRIVAVLLASPLTVTVDRPISEATATVGTYQVYRAYIKPPVPDFSRWDSFDSYVWNRTRTGNALTKTSVDFDRMDPRRASSGPMTYLGSLIADTSNALPALYEIWPHPMAGDTFTVTFKRNGPPFTLPTDIQPQVVPDSLIMARAMGWYGAVWGQANKSRIPDLKGIDFNVLIQEARARYKDDLRLIKLQDDDKALDSVYNRGHYGGGRSGVGLPIGDAAYWQQHPITW